MDANFWLERWREGQTHFHQERVTPLLQKYWPLLALPRGSRVLVPLCGKSLDMVWLAQQGLQVLGVELSQLAVEQFFAENGLSPTVRPSAIEGILHFTDGDIEILCGDIFKLDAAILAGCDAVYDRAALIALPPAMRASYVRHIYGQLPQRYSGLLITLDYPQQEMEGPPFSVGQPEVDRLYADHTAVQVLDRRSILDKEPRFAERGVTRLDTIVFRLQGKQDAQGSASAR